MKRILRRLCFINKNNFVLTKVKVAATLACEISYFDCNFSAKHILCRFYYHS